MDKNFQNQGYQMQNMNQMNPNPNMNYNPNMPINYNPNMPINYNPNMPINYDPNMQGNFMPNQQMGYNPNMAPMGFNANMAPPGMNMGMPEIFQMGNNMTAFFERTSYMDALGKAKAAYIKQKVEYMEQFTGCETNNRYNVFLKYPDGSYVYIFKAKEDSSWCSRNCLTSDCRPFSMKIKWIKSGVKEPKEFDEPFITFERPYKWTCLCLSRPEITGFNHSENRNFGRIYEPFKCCDPNFQIFNEKNELKYLVAGDCCQCGIMCRSCGKCCETNFYIFDGKNPSRDPSQSIGSITRKNPGIAKAMFTDADNFDVAFPENATPYDKLMIIGATLMIDYAFFEDEAGHDHHHNHY